MSLEAVGSEAVLGFIPLSARIERFRDASRARGAAARSTQRWRHFNDAFLNRYAARPYWERYARSLAHSLEQEPAYLFDDEQLVGMTYQLDPDPTGPPDECLPHVHAAERYADLDIYFDAGAWPGHVAWRWDLLLELGVEGLMRRLRTLLEQASDARAKRLYRGALILWRSALRWNDSHVAALKKKALAAVGPERARLERLTALCRRVPRHPAQTFHEAVQAFYFQHLVVSTTSSGRTSSETCKQASSPKRRPRS